VRNRFAELLTAQAEVDNSIVLLVGDIGYGVFENFKRKFPDRYFNVGIAEQNSIGLMSGLAKEGFFPVFFTIIPFLLYRPFEQIRNDLLINERNCLLVGVGAGISYGPLGPTHHAVEDSALCRALPKLKVYSPSSLESLDDIFSTIFHKMSGVDYIRLGRSQDSFSRHMQIENLIDLKENSPQPMNSNTTVILSYGDTFAKVYNTLAPYIEELHLLILSVNQIQPLAKEKLLNVLENVARLILIEEQFDGSSLYAQVCEIMVSKKISLPVFQINLGRNYIDMVGDASQIRDMFGLQGDSLRGKVEKIINGH